MASLGQPHKKQLNIFSPVQDFKKCPSHAHGQSLKSLSVFGEGRIEKTSG